tara:strand:- start:2 stop:385 length:384 start_codon:yes stop_codon:yes gene_type:complete
MSKVDIYREQMTDKNLSNYIDELEKFFHVFSQELKKQNRTCQFGSYWTDEELAEYIKENWWNQPGEWLDEYRDKKGNLTDKFFEDVNESGDFRCCDGCDKWGEIGMNYHFEEDFYCDMCVVNDIAKL